MYAYFKCECESVYNTCLYMYIYIYRIPDGKSPRFPRKPTIRQEDDILIMECILEAYPSPEITWFMGEERLENSERMRMLCKATSKDTFMLGLEIRNPSQSDRGIYRCQALNTFGNSNAHITLNFQGTYDKSPLTASKKPSFSLSLSQCIFLSQYWATTPSLIPFLHLFFSFCTP